MSLLRSLTRANRARFSLDGSAPEGPGEDGRPWTVSRWVSFLARKYQVSRESILCPLIELTDMPESQKLELQSALKSIRDGLVPEEEWR